MVQEQEALREQLSDLQLRTLAYFAIGVASEGSMAGRNVAYKLSFAGSVGNGIMRPVGNSGFSIGTLQTDLGQHPQVATGLVDAYQAWAAQQTPSLALSPQEREQTIHDCSATATRFVPKTVAPRTQRYRPTSTTSSHPTTALVSSTNTTARRWPT